MRVRNRPPVHPGGILKRHYLYPLGLTISQVAIALGVSRQTLSNILHERASITPNMALRLSRAFDTSPELWMRLQEAYNLWYAARHSDEWQRVRKISKLATLISP